MTEINFKSKFLITARFDNNIQEQIIDALDKLCIKLPENNSQFFSGFMGNMLFLEDYGVSVKIEKITDPNENNRALHPNIIQPIASIRARNVLINIIPGVNLNSVEQKHNDKLNKKLSEWGIDFADDGLRNIGMMPIINEKNPKGIPVVLDSLAAYDFEIKKEKGFCHSYSEYLEMAKEVLTERKELYKNSPQEKFYRPLKNLFDIALKSGKEEDFQKAWEECLKFKDQGKLISGWKNLVMAEEVTLKDKHPDINTISIQYKDLQPFVKPKDI